MLRFPGIRRAARLLIHQPTFSAVAVATLALGIGANAAVFSAVYAVLLKPLPYEDPSELYVIWEDAARLGFLKNTPAPANYLDWKTESRSFEDMAAFTEGSFNLTGVDEPEELSGLRVTWDFFALLGSSAGHGRVFAKEDGEPGSPSVAILTHRLWIRRFGGDRSMIGKTITLDGNPATVIGIMPESFRFPGGEGELFLPLRFTAEERQNRGGHYLQVIGRLAPGVGREEAQSEMSAIARRLELAFPKTNTHLGARIEPLRDELAGDVRPVLMVLFVAVGLLLIIACANLASLFLARATARSREMGTRLALGASTRDLARQLLTESVMVTAVGAALGIGLAHLSLALVERLLPASMTAMGKITLDAPVLAFTLTVAAAAGIVSGTLPALQATGIDLSRALREGGRGSAPGRSSFRRALVVGETALAVMLLVGGLLLTRSLLALMDVPLGFAPENAVTVRTTLPPGKYESLESRVAFYRRVLEQIESLPGIESAGYTSGLPLTFSGNNWMFSPEGQPDRPPGQERIASIRVITPRFFQAMGMVVLRGRSIDHGDDISASRVAVINEQMARQFWPGEDPLGRRFKLGPAREEVPWFTIVGIVNDVRQWGLDVDPRPEVYFSYAQTSFTYPRDLVVRSSMDPDGIARAVRRTIREADPDQPVSAPKTLDEIVGDSVARQRLQGWLVGGFAVLALALSSAGLYGIMSFEVSRRIREMGVRLALGAKPAAVLRLLLKQGMSLALLGLLLGLAGAAALSWTIESFLFGTNPLDPVSLALSSGALLAVALAACWLPAYRATRVDPVGILRQE